MTTIAWDGATVAADGKAVTGNGNVVTRDAVKLRAGHGCVYALSGAHFLFDDLVAWHRAGAPKADVPRVHDEHPWFFLVFESGGVRMTDHTMGGCWDNTAKAPWAWGSGADLAIGAMLAEATARRAVKIASWVDNGSGGKIVEINLMTLRRSEAAE